MSRTEPGLEWTPRAFRDSHIAAIRRMKIGPLFPSDPDHRPGMREDRRVVRLGKDTKPPYHRPSRRARKAADRVTAHCLSCRWSSKGSTWRPVKRALREHTAKKHPEVAA